ncbi:PepSY domain-containing protein [Vibrio jasicida]|uniref:PepSY domain-containing protein n=1 Tax=Vibrio jasicida TaxID=766224 RepID=UPI0003AA40E9|nr:membrane protein [Vibrio jasicida]
MSKSFITRKLPMLLGLVPLLLSAPSFANHHDHNDHHDDKDGHAIVRDVEKPGTRIEFDEDQDEVYRAVQKGYIRPFSDMYEAVENDLYGRIIKVELEEDDDEWVYELKILFDDSVIKVEYDAATLEMLEIKGRNFNKALKPQ